MSKLTKLTGAQRDFAAENHDLVLQYLGAKGLSEDEFYDIAIFGYLRAVQVYDQRPELRRYSFRTIAYKRMYAAIWNHFRSLRTAKRSAEVLSLNFTGDDGMEFSEQLAADTPAVYEYADIRAAWEAAKAAATPKQMQALKLRARGYSSREIGKAYNLTPNAIYGRVYRLRKNTARLAA
jgi:RNA polymerase sigma-70 factor (ECF subfamily)